MTTISAIRGSPIPKPIPRPTLSPVVKLLGCTVGMSDAVGPITALPVLPVGTSVIVAAGGVYVIDAIEADAVTVFVTVLADASEGCTIRNGCEEKRVAFVLAW